MRAVSLRVIGDVFNVINANTVLDPEQQHPVDGVQHASRRTSARGSSGSGLVFGF